MERAPLLTDGVAFVVACVVVVTSGLTYTRGRVFDVIKRRASPAPVRFDQTARLFVERGSGATLKLTTLGAGALLPDARPQTALPRKHVPLRRAVIKVGSRTGVVVEEGASRGVGRKLAKQRVELSEIKRCGLRRVLPVSRVAPPPLKRVKRELKPRLKRAAPRAVVSVVPF